MKKKWEDESDKDDNEASKSKKCLSYFEHQWIHKMPGCYEGYHFGTPTSNNGVEGMNSAIKRVYTKHIIKNFPELQYDFVK